MLDAYIIDRIRRERERERRDGAFVPLHIEPPDSHREREEDRQNEKIYDPGSTVIDFCV